MGNQSSMGQEVHVGRDRMGIDSKGDKK
jgi:hypothetical protein